MPKPRLKSEIRAMAQAESARLKNITESRAAFLQPRARSWHDLALRAIGQGASYAQAARDAGISRSGLYRAIHDEPHFREACLAAQAEYHRRQKTSRRPRTVQRLMNTLQRKNRHATRSQLGPQKMDRLA